MNLFRRFLQVRYTPLPTTSKSNSRQLAVLLIPKRYIRLFLFILAASAVILFIYASSPIRYPDYPEIKLTPQENSELPPLYEEYRSYEDRLSEWNMKTYGKAGDRYVYVSSHAGGAGWGNIMQEMVFSSLLASGSGRGFVWDEYVWNNDSSKYSEYNGKLIPSRIPFSALIAGHILGLPTSPELPPSISLRLYDRICPQRDRLYLDDAMVKEHVGLPKRNDDLLWRKPGQEVLDAWLSLLNSPDVRDKRCVVIGGPQIFTIWILHTPRVHSLVKTLFSSPVVNNWGWSKLVMGVFRKNIQLFVNTSLHSDTPSSQDKDNAIVPSSNDGFPLQNNTPLPLLALHLRRGDYEDHCQNLAQYRAKYVGMVTLPEFEEKDPFVLPTESYDEKSVVPEEVSAFYAKRCYPNATQVGQRVREVLHDYEQVLDAEDREKFGRGSRSLSPLVKAKVKKVYIMSNGDAQWLDEVKKELMEDAKRSADNVEWEFAWSWEDIGHSRDLIAGWEEKRVLQLVDMYVGQRAELFVGNGFSTLTSNIVMLRKHNGFRPVQTRFW